jgi:hypothetical protein
METNVDRQPIPGIGRASEYQAHTPRHCGPVELGFTVVGCFGPRSQTDCPRERQYRTLQSARRVPSLCTRNQLKRHNLRLVERYPRAPRPDKISHPCVDSSRPAAQRKPATSLQLWMCLHTSTERSVGLPFPTLHPIESCALKKENSRGSCALGLITQSIQASNSGQRERASRIEVPGCPIRDKQPGVIMLHFPNPAQVQARQRRIVVRRGRRISQARN